MEKRKLNKQPEKITPSLKRMLKAAGGMVAVLDVKLEDGHLRVDIYWKGDKESRYIHYVDRNEYCTYEPKTKRWKTGTIDWYMPCYYGTQVRSLKRSDYATRAYFTPAPGYNTYQILNNIEHRYRDEKQADRERTRQRAVDDLMEKYQEPTEEFKQWAWDNMEHFIVYQYSRNVKKGYCTHCGKRVDIAIKPHHNQIGTCSSCKAKIKYKCKGRPESKRVFTIVEWQTDEEYVIRYFEGRQKLDGSYPPKRMKHLWEFKRLFRSVYSKHEEDYTYDFHNKHLQEMSWGEGYKAHGMFNWQTTIYDHMAGLIYPGTMEETEEKLQTYVPLKKWAEHGIDIYPKALIDATMTPYKTAIESLVKCGMYQLAETAAFQQRDLYTITRQHVVQDPNARSIIDIMGLSKREWNLLRTIPEVFRDKETLHILRSISEQSQGWQPTLSQLMQMRKIGPMTSEALLELRKYASMNKVLKYVCTLPENRRSEYPDYIHQRERLGYQMDSIGMFPKDFEAMHQRLTLELEVQKRNKRAKEVNKQFAKIAELHKEIEKKYGWIGNKYIFIAPKNAADILDEGSALHHCVGSGTTYYKRYVEGQSYIVFCRHKESPDTRFVTIEIQGDKILQWFGAYDRKTDEEDDVRKELRQWKKALKEREKVS